MLRYEKVYVSVILRVDTEGVATPLSVEWADGRSYAVTRVLDVRMAPPPHVGGVMTRLYTCFFSGARRELFLETQTNRWFVERLVL